ncbi:uncharacterized protein LOC121267039 [Juglans microcarpa x Juglans regia]|uniref:uncharacterized protein LOC121267039 n=1 Tax=Juglans microcarpa x Juglans regia TaxID=2249226 RepID=UPI001B7F3F30|nr:uncharacterized protein LOC121267039 [Juglans microcarpa x Juglans regia]
MVGELSNTMHSQKPIFHLENEDAICKRTRANYSLASFTLDELETFLQETDDDEDLQNVDDEEEYRKFLAAVLHDGDGDGQPNQENENVDDEDEDNDADFEIELEELLESDIDECNGNKTQKEYIGAGRRPETRQNRCQKDAAQYKKKLSGQANRPLRPLLPVLPNGPIVPFSTNDGKTLMPDYFTAEDGLIKGFTLHQIGQLHCLIHEHLQLLVQVRGLICEMLQKPNEVLAWKSVPYASIFFYPPYVCSSVPDESPKFSPAQCSLKSCTTFNAQSVCSNHMEAFISMSPPNGSGPVLSITDVAPFNLVGRYMDDVYTAVQDYRRRQVKSGSEAPFPPLAAVVNRVLFTDAEDGLLALGWMEYNTDWKAIQQRFLPCKLTHQIFVWQKNCCSSKAPENPIKAVRRMKTSPLTVEEIASIQEGLKLYKMDWISVWKFVVPHRDPSLLPQQWRIALGTQRSYKQDAAKKEKR